MAQYCGVENKAVMQMIEVVVETPAGSRCKYDHDPERDRFKLKKMLPAGMVFPYDFGYIPGTLGEDGDPLDIILIAECSHFPGCVVECRLIGGFKALQKDPKEKIKLRNDRFFAVPASSIMFEKIKELKDLPTQLLDELEAFFVQYNKMEGKEFTVKGKMNSRQAGKLVEAGKKIG
jgi:inorganic pyrophosphatase